MAHDYHAWKAADAARRTLAARLREGPATPELVAEAAAAIDHLHERIAQMQRDARDEQREAQRDARAAASEGYWQGRQESEGSYGSY